MKIGKLTKDKVFSVEFSINSNSTLHSSFPWNYTTADVWRQIQHSASGPRTHSDVDSPHIRVIMPPLTAVVELPNPSAMASFHIDASPQGLASDFSSGNNGLWFLFSPKGSECNHPSLHSTTISSWQQLFPMPRPCRKPSITRCLPYTQSCSQ